jgi:hypothetical protein
MAKELIESQLGISGPEDWYNVTSGSIAKLTGGKQLAKVYSVLDIASVAICIFHHSFMKTFYPHHQWVHGRFKKAPENTWTDKKKTRDYLAYLATVFLCVEPSDWYYVSREQVTEVGTSETHSNSWSRLEQRDFFVCSEGSIMPLSSLTRKLIGTRFLLLQGRKIRSKGGL